MKSENLMNELSVSDVYGKYEFLTKLLIEKKLTITTMESITSGLIASLITDTEGASAVLKGAFVTYSNETKIKMGVDSEVIDGYGVYSKETAMEMAKAARRMISADISIGITGSAGNVDPNNHDSVPGQCFYSIIYKDIEFCDLFMMSELPSRRDYKLFAAEQVVDAILNLLRG